MKMVHKLVSVSLAASLLVSNLSAAFAGCPKSASSRQSLTGSQTFPGLDAMRQAVAISQVDSKRKARAAEMVLVGYRMIWQGNQLAAMRAFNQALALDPNNYAALIDRAAIQFNSRNLRSDPEADCLRAIAVSPERAAAYNTLGTIYEDRHAFGLAEQAYRTAIDLRADYSEQTFNLLGLLRSKSSVSMTKDARLAVMRFPKSFESHYFLVMALMRENKTEQAYNAANEAVNVLPSHAALHECRGWLLAKLGRYEDSVRAFSQQIALDPDSGEGYLNRAQVSLKLGDDKGAAQDFQSALGLERLYQDQSIHAVFAAREKLLLRDYQGNFDKLEPQDLACCLARGNYWRRWNYGNAMGHFQMAIKAAPNDFRGYLYRAELLAHLKQNLTALADFDSACRLAPNNFWCFSRRAYSRAILGLNAGAVADFTKGMRGGRDHYSLCARGMVYASMGDYRLAIADFDQVLSYGDKRVERQALNIRCRAKFKAGDKFGAISDFLELALRYGMSNDIAECLRNTLR